jgi:hypothetical protein
MPMGITLMEKRYILQIDTITASGVRPYFLGLFSTPQEAVLCAIGQGGKRKGPSHGFIELGVAYPMRRKVVQGFGRIAFRVHELSIVTMEYLA